MGLAATVISYLRYRFRAKNAHGIHSPFFFKLYNEVINARGNYYSFDRIDALRKILLQSDKQIQVTDLGTGTSGLRKMSSIASSSGITPKYGALLFRLSHYFKPECILELGTSLGLGTAYLASANKSTEVHSVEGCPDTAALAAAHFKKLGLTNIHIHNGSIDKLLPGILKNLKRKPELVFMDANHTYKATLHYFDILSQYLNDETIVIVDDIHWSSGMEKAWKKLKSHNRVTASVDLYRMGLLFFRPALSKEHFVLRY